MTANEGNAELKLSTHSEFLLFKKKTEKQKTITSPDGTVTVESVNDEHELFFIRFNVNVACAVAAGIVTTIVLKYLSKLSEKAASVDREPLYIGSPVVTITTCGLRSGENSLLGGKFGRPDDFFKSKFVDTTNLVGGSDSDGLVSWISANGTYPESLNATVTKVTKDLQSILGVVNGFYNKQSPDNKYNMKLWNAIFDHLPNMGASGVTDKTFKQTVVGIEVAAKFISFLFDAIVTGGTGMAAFGTFLNSLGGEIRAGAKKSSSSYKTVINSLINEFVYLGDHVEYVPKIKMQYIEFTESNLEITSSCASYKQFNFDLKFQERVAVFNWQSMYNDDGTLSKIGTAVRDFITGNVVKNIADDQNFFGGDFDAKSNQGSGVANLILGYQFSPLEKSRISRAFQSVKGSRNIAIDEENGEN